MARWAAHLRADTSLLVIDAVLCVVSYAAVLVMLFNGSVPQRYWSRFWAFVPIAVLLQVASNWAWRLYGQMWHHASVQEARRMLLAGTMAMALLLPPVLYHRGWVPLPVIVLGGCIATMLMGAVRFQARLFAFKRARNRHSGTRLAIIGAGESGAAIIREMLRDADGSLRPVVVLDDDPRKHGRGLLGIPIAGGVADLAALARRFDVHQVLVAVPSATKDDLERVASIVATANLPLKVLPAVADLVRGKVSIRDARNLRIEDLLGREQIETDLDAVRSLLAGRRVLITGAGGSIGAEIVRQVAEWQPEGLIALDHDETHLYDAVQALPVRVVQVLADIRDADEIERVFRTHRPDVVFHAAAHKHVPILESHACEAASTNVMGTRNIVASAVSAGTGHLVLISTDKAVRPTSVMGASKWLSEQVMLSVAPPDARYCAVRFGNVLGSRGSVIPTFARQIAAGGPVTVTDPRMTRFFMSIKEAVQLVLQAAALAAGRDIFMLEMGEPVSIYDLAHKMIRLSGYEPGTDIQLMITGMRPGEKLREELRAPGETISATLHPSILRVKPHRLAGPALDSAVGQLAACVRARLHGEAAALLRELPFRPGTLIDGSDGDGVLLELR